MRTSFKVSESCPQQVFGKVPERGGGPMGWYPADQVCICSCDCGSSPNCSGGRGSLHMLCTTTQRSVCIESSCLLRVELKEICEHQGRIHVSLPFILKLNQLLSNLLQSPFLGVRSVACPCLEMLYYRSEVEGVCGHNPNLCKWICM